MATLEDAINAGRLDSFELPEWERRCPVRPLYATRGFFDWVENTTALYSQKSAIGGRTLFEHLEQIFCEFRCAKEVHYSDLKRMMPTGDGVWHMYPRGLRIYGWCPAKHAFVAVCGALVGDTKNDSRLNDRKRKEVLAFIRSARLEATVTRGEFFEVFPKES